MRTTTRQFQDDPFENIYTIRFDPRDPLWVFSEYFPLENKDFIRKRGASVNGFLAHEVCEVEEILPHDQLENLR